MSKLVRRYRCFQLNGHFTFAKAKREAGQHNKHNYYFFGAGSGITPLISMLSSVLHDQPSAYCFLLYGNRDEDNIIFRKKIDRLQMVNKVRLRLKYILGRPLKIKKSSFFKAYKVSQPPWQGQVGRVDKKASKTF